MEGIVQSLVDFFSNTIPAELTVFTLSLMPIIELRGGILAAKLLVNRLEAKGRSKFDKINRYKTLGLLIFVAIPLPGTGAWTGSLAAALMKMDFKSAMISVAGGTLVADIIMCLLSYGVLGMVL